MAKKRKTLIRLGKFKGAGTATDGKAIQTISRINPHNANRRYLIPNHFAKKADV